MIEQHHTGGKEWRSLAIFSDDEKYRYLLKRSWGVGRNILFIMLNPSTADAKKNDPTVKRCCDYAKKWGFASITVCNLFGYRSTQPEALVTVENPVGVANMAYIENAMTMSDTIVAAWGNNVLPNFHMHTVYMVSEKARELGKDIFCLGINDNGQPVHPLYQKADVELKVWRKA